MNIYLLLLSLTKNNTIFRNFNLLRLLRISLNLKFKSLNNFALSINILEIKLIEFFSVFLVLTKLVKYSFHY